MRPLKPLVFEQVISKPRLDSYKSYFRTRSTEEAIGLYMWNNEISLCFGALLSMFEIALRNSIHSSMSAFYSRHTSTSHHWYDTIKRSLKPSTFSKVDDVRYEGYGATKRLRHPAPSPDEIVSRVTFGFWPGVLSTIDSRYADALLSSIFPYHSLNSTPLDWKDAPTRKRELAFLYELNQFRNRIAHHEPLWKFSAILDTSTHPATVVVPASTNHTDSVFRFQRLLNILDDAINTINQDLHHDMKQSSWRHELDYLLSKRGFERYKALNHRPENCSVTPTEFRQNFKIIVNHNQPIYVRRSGMRGIFIPD